MIDAATRPGPIPAGLKCRARNRIRFSGAETTLHTGQGADPRRIGFGKKLIPAALLRRLVGPPAQEFGAVPETAAADMVVAHLGDQLGPQRLPRAAPFGAP